MSEKILTKKFPGLGRIGFVHESAGNGSGFLSSSRPQGHLSAQVIRDGQPVNAKQILSFWSRFWNNIKANDTCIDLGSGLVTNVGVTALANDFAWGANFQTLKLANQHVSGKGTTAAAATDIALQTLSTNGGQTAVAGTQTLLSTANTQKYQTVATISYTGTEAVTEWGLMTSATLSATTGSPATASSATSLTATGTPYTASSSTVRGQTQFIVVDTASSPNVYGLVTANSTGGFTVPAWYKTTDGTAGATPGATDAFAIYPVMWDHKTFSAINVVSGDSIQFTYQLTCTSGG